MSLLLSRVEVEAEAEVGGEVEVLFLVKVVWVVLVEVVEVLLLFILWTATSYWYVGKKRIYCM